ncbi:MAG: DNA-binding response regulator [Deltaproteobacteria bacterium HGW-Deltaproteobacteria-8]|jgi:DNA-binding NarL/FixJ family response regulator|nr:MAG: DNA-binding response regulator [Deltaproteobacteria bacterium HGW-Deltaproteobacteria-8]
MTRNHAIAARIFLADDHPAVLDGLALLFAQARHTICGAARSREEMLERIDASEPDIALVDLTLCGESGLDLIPEILARSIPVLVYSMHEDTATVKRALDHGVHGYVTKREASSVLLEAVQRILDGGRFISPRATASQEAPGQTHEQGSSSEPLSNRERQTLTLLANGESNAEIAALLQVSIRTVETYFSRISTKLSLEGMKELRRYAFKMYR